MAWFCLQTLYRPAACRPPLKLGSKSTRRSYVKPYSLPQPANRETWLTSLPGEECLLVTPPPQRTGFPVDSQEFQHLLVKPVHDGLRPMESQDFKAFRSPAEQPLPDAKSSLASAAMGRKAPPGFLPVDVLPMPPYSYARARGTVHISSVSTTS